MSFALIDALGTTATVADVFSDRSLVAAMLQFEVALARVEALSGLIPAEAAAAIAAAANPDAFDAAAIASAARSSGTIAIAFVERLTVLVREQAGANAGFVHWGATSQDVTDTALVLCLANARLLLER